MKNKISIFFRVIYAACIISCILLCSCLISNVLGRYLVQSESADGARVAKFYVTASTTSQSNFELTETEPTAEYKFSVTSNSEVYVSYDLVLTLPSNTPTDIGLEFILGNESKQYTSESGSSITFENVGSFTPGAEEKTNAHSLIIKTTNFNDAVSLEEIEVKIIAFQVD